MTGKGKAEKGGDRLEEKSQLALLCSYAQESQPSPTKMFVSIVMWERRSKKRGEEGSEEGKKGSEGGREGEGGKKGRAGGRE